MATNQRAFTQKLTKHHAADVRKTVSNKTGLISPSSSSSWTHEIVEPLDFEEFVGAYQLVIDRDPLRCILDVPQGDVQVDIIERPVRTLKHILPEEKIETLAPHVQACVECYKSVWKVIRYTHRQLSSSTTSRLNLSKTLPPSPKQEFEVDFQAPSETTSELDLTSQGTGSSRQSIVSIGSLSSCGDTLTPRNSWASLDLRHSAGDALIPEILEQSILESQDQVNESQRQIERQETVFALVPQDFQTEIQEPVEKRLPANAPSEHLGHRVLVKCQQLTMDIEVEPLFASMALYDSKEKKKVSETFYFDVNPEGLKRMLGGHVAYADPSTLARSCIFNITHPSPDLFIVVRLEKVLQGDINECVEPYLKEEKNRDKLKSIAVSVCERLGKYRQAFAWTAINLVNITNGGNSLEREFDRDSTGTGSNTNSLDRKSSSSGLDQLRRKATDMGTLTRRGSLERKDKCRSWSPDHLATNLDTFRPITLTMSSFFKQEGDKLRDDDLYKCLQELKRPTLVLKKLKCIPATFKLEISPCPPELKNCLTTELAKLHPYPDDKSRPTKELLEFPVKEILVPHYIYRNLLFVSPKDLNFSNRNGSARNLAVKIQLMAGESDTHCLPNIFGKSSCPEMAAEVFSAVTYHSKNPVFYDEFKIKLPASLADNHHLLFTFYHISCQKKVEQNVVETPVGYTWLPLLRDGRLVSGEFCLPVMLEPPPRNYSYIPPDVFLPGMKWLDSHKGLFTVILDTASSVHTHDPPIERFFAAYDYVNTGLIPTRLGEVGSEKELTTSMLGLAGARPETIVKHLPQIFDSLIELLVQPPRISGHMINVGSTCFETLCLLLENISNLQELASDQHGRNSLLATYIQYQCNIPHPSTGGTRGSPSWETSGLVRSNSNPDLEVSHYQPRGLDRAASMRVPTNEPPVSPSFNSCPRIVHQELAYQWTITSGRNKDLAMQNAWFLFELMIKSMVEHLAHTRSLDAPRKIRFPDQFLDDISSLVQYVTMEIIGHSAGEIRKAHKLNAALAFFFFDLLSIADRGWVLQLLRSYIKDIQTKISSNADGSILVELKLEFARIICSHEHYVALNLPFSSPFMSSAASVSPSPSVTSSTSQNSFLSGAPPSQERVNTFAELSPEYRQHHYLAGMILGDLATVLLETHLPSLHLKAVDTIKSLLSWHDSDPRYLSPEARHRVAALYFPLLSIAMDVLPLLHSFSADKNDSRFTHDDLGPTNINPNVAMVIAGKLPHSTCDSFQTLQNRKGISAEATRNLLTCVLWTLKNVERESLSQWMSELSSSRLATLLHLLDACTSCFEYRPRRRAPPSSGYAHAQVTQDMRSRLEDIILGQGSAREMMQRRKGGTPQAATEKLRWRKEQMTYRVSTDLQERPRDDTYHDAHLDGHFATEASFIILDSLERSVSTIAQLDTQQHLVGLALSVLLHALGKNQSTTVLPHMFASQRSLVFKFHSALFDEESSHCADLCLLLLKHCGSQIAAVRSQSAASLYLLMRQTFQIGNNFARVKMQVTMSLSSLVGTSSSFSDDSLRRSLKTILEYGERDLELQETTFPEQVRDLVFNLHMILSDTVKMKEFQEDPEMLLDLMYRIAKGYQNSPDLRLTWLANMAQKHMERGNHTEAGMCLVHSAALVAEYLAMLESLPYLPAGAAALEKVSPNVLEESAVSDDVLSPEREGGCLGSHFTEAGLLGLLEHAASSFQVAAMYEPMNDIYRVLIPIAENNRDFKKLSNIHGKLHDAYTRIDQLQGKRMFGTYFRVGFYGSKFGDLDKEEFVYKEPTLTKLPEIFSRLENFYAERFGAENVCIIKDSNIVDLNSLDPDKAYIQITYVEPYFEQFELRYRQTHFDRNFNIKKFVYATPFTMTGKAHGELKDQYKRKTILTTSVHFPYVKTRIQVVARIQITLTPIEVAIEDIQKKTTELAIATQQEPPDPKILQMVLQGCIGTTVNQGPLEMAQTFLPGDGKPLTKHQNKLRLCFKDFSKKCCDALKKNKNLIGPDQRDYQRELDRNYKKFIEKLQPLVNPQNITIVNTSPNKFSNAPETSLLRW
ncbi:unnamed protein product [Ceutorhynchus assimilis]|uniref:Dedicator of cytokinesis protein 7 n=1 Tax=Ceutorhynchus assimilis TaxID=467358 RepID=A0A9N9QKD2_9CUCU|nr:unnamed protein product [Ceutorhynchus assimilis]